MDIVLLGLDTRFINELSDLISKNINCMSVFPYFNMHDLFHRINNDWVDVLLVEVNTRNFKICFQLADQMFEKNSEVIVVFLCEYVLLDWQKKAKKKQIYLLSKKKDYYEIISKVSKIIRYKGSEMCHLESMELLTPREEEILRLVAQGVKQDAIAEDLKISRKTVQNHLAHISEKLNTTSQIESVVRAIELGIVSVDYVLYEDF